MKIICTDNFNRELVDEWLVAENVTSQCVGERIVNLLNVQEGLESPNYFRLVNDDYKLFKFES